MSPNAFDPLARAMYIALPVAAIATPVFWRVARGLSRAPRIAMTSLSCLGLSGLASTPFFLGVDDSTETAAAAIFVSAILQGLALPVLLLIARKS